MSPPKRTKQSGIVQILRNRVLRGRYPGRLPGERALAAELGTTPRTIAVALAQLAALGVVRRVARQGTFAVPSGSSRRVPGIVYARFVSYVHMRALGPPTLWGTNVIYAFQKRAHEHGLSTALEYSDDVDHLVDRATAEAHVPGCIGTCTLSAPVEARHVLRLAEAGGPIVVADTELDEPLVPCLDFDNVGAGRLLVEHLFGLGHRRFAFVDYGESRTPPRMARLRGVEEALNRLGLPLTKVHLPPLQGADALHALLKSSRAPTAVICGDTGAAAALTDAAADLGKHVPQDLSVVSFGQQPPLGGGPVTIAAMAHAEMGNRALAMLLDEELLFHPRRVFVNAKLVESDQKTTAPPAEV